MKNRPLAIQIWIVFGVTLCLLLILALILIPWTLRIFFTREIYVTIENAQALLLEYGETGKLFQQMPPNERNEQFRNMRRVNHVMFFADGRLFSPNFLEPTLLEQLRQEAFVQKSDTGRYSKSVNTRRLFYVIRKVKVSGHDAYLLSYMWETYRNDLVKKLFSQLMFIMVGALLLSWIPSIWFARYLTRPLVALEKYVKRVSERDWHEPLQLERKDEIGRLAESIERMRLQLLQHDETQRSFLQHISHELKTPVMVIRSYVQAIRDGIYPKGDLPSTVEVIDNESERLEKRIHDLLYLTKLDYVSKQEPVRDNIDLAELVDEIVDRLRWRRPNLNWALDLIPVEIQGDREQWTVAMENLLDNQIRYAENTVEISLAMISGNEKAKALVRIWNDGPPLEPGVADTLFDQFRKGSDGEFGLGLTIVHRIANLHHAKVWACNEKDGVAFYLKI
ncbi:sensor histidine kinase [Zhaonella formicivorans]|uniref:sensor histidine kinase n=1 Tax=Zhaonella formicivorans TaxID=2528593 RepID=UPI0010DEA627|nr:histidine kinase dimerization/phospho-acceptor domain-containing protein [Zhaonella formicivorans]